MIHPIRWSTRLELLPPESVRALQAASLRILEHTGIVMPLTPARQRQAQDLGLRIDTALQRVYFAPEIVEAALTKAPQRYSLCARDPENDIDLDGQRGYMCLDGCGTAVLDAASGQARPSTKADLAAAVRLADALPQISFLWPTVSAQDYPPAVQPLHELEACFLNSSKHVQAMTAVNALNARGTVAMAAEVAGGRDALRARPLVSTFLSSVSPLSFHSDALEAAFVFGEAGLPTGFICMPIGGATAPITPAGSAALANAEVLAGIVLFQLFFPGTPTFYGSYATMMDLRTGGITSGGPEDFWLQAAACQLAHAFGLPANIGTFATGAKASNWHAAVENGISGAVSQFTGVDMMCGAGLLNGARVFSAEQLLMDCEIYDLLRAVSQGYAVNAETLALDEIVEIGPQNNYLTTTHTLAHMRDLWQPTIIERMSWEDWVDRNRPTPADQARQLARKFQSPVASAAPARRRDPRNETLRRLDSYTPQPLACADQLREIITDYERQADR